MRAELMNCSVNYEEDDFNCKVAVKERDHFHPNIAGVCWEQWEIWLGEGQTNWTSKAFWTTSLEERKGVSKQ